METLVDNESDESEMLAFVELLIREDLREMFSSSSADADSGDDDETRRFLQGRTPRKRKKEDRPPYEEELEDFIAYVCVLGNIVLIFQ